MTGESTWPLRPRIELLNGAQIALEEAGRHPRPLLGKAVDSFFAIGLHQRTRPTSRVQVVLKGNAKFLVGELDLGPRLGMQVLSRGLECAVDMAIEDYEYAGADQRLPPEDGLLSGEPTAGEVLVPIDEVGERLYSLLDERVRLWHRVVLTDDGRRVAVLVSWDWYSMQHERAGWATAAYWAHWRSGRFDSAGHAADLRTMRRRASDHRPGVADASARFEGGSGDHAR